LSFLNIARDEKKKRDEKGKQAIHLPELIMAEDFDLFEALDTFITQPKIRSFKSCLRTTKDSNNKYLPMIKLLLFMIVP
jgi:hypothetical protein